MECFFPLDLPLVFLVLLPWSVQGKFIVKGPEQPIIALVGTEATFPCYLSPQLDARQMEVIWFYEQSPRVVYHYTYRRDYMEDQHQNYQGRTEFLQENISSGSVALRIHNIRPSDEGKYRCYFESSIHDDEIEFQVYVAGMGSTPQIHIEGDGNKRIRLVCTSEGWYPEPEVQWRDHHRKILPGGTVIKKKENGLFSVETSITVFASSKENVSCFICNSVLKENLEASVSLADDLFPNMSPWLVAWIVTLILISIVSSIFISWNWKLNKAKGILKHQKDRLNDNIGRRNEETDKLNNEVDMLNYEVVELNNEVGNLNREIGDLNNEVGELNNEIDKLQDRINILKDKLGLTKFVTRHRVTVVWDEDKHHYFFLQRNDEIVLASYQNNPIGNLSCLVGTVKFMSGSYYWEMNVEGKTKWALGFCKIFWNCIEKQVKPETGFWILCLMDKDNYQVLSRPWTHFHLPVPPKIVGIFLDYEAGQISFYNVTDKTHIYTFHDTFDGSLWPFSYSIS